MIPRLALNINDVFLFPAGPYPVPATTGLGCQGEMRNPIRQALLKTLNISRVSLNQTSTIYSWRNKSELWSTIARDYFFMAYRQKSRHVMLYV